jgi:sulfatase modifying factor 1
VSDARSACLALIAVALAACSGAPVANELRVRATRRVPPAPVRAARDGSSADGFLALTPPLFERGHLRAGSFWMGSTQNEVGRALESCGAEPLGDPELCEKREYANEMSDHEVYLSDYWIDRTEVTVERYRVCVSTGACPELPYAAGGGRFDVPEYPAVLLTWFDARRFCAWAGGRLPTEAEWERAARGMSGRRYPWGNVYNPFLLNHGRLAYDELDDGDGYLELAPAGSYPEGATPDGILDLAGNAEEWVADWYAGPYADASVMNPKGAAVGDERVVRGGSFGHPAASLRGAARDHALPDQRRAWRGFRCAYDPK